MATISLVVRDSQPSTPSRALDSHDEAPTLGELTGLIDKLK
jgi:hypothetical protein